MLSAFLRASLSSSSSSFLASLIALTAPPVRIRSCWKRRRDRNTFWFIFSTTRNINNIAIKTNEHSPKMKQQLRGNSNFVSGGAIKFNKLQMQIQEEKQEAKQDSPSYKTPYYEDLKEQLVERCKKIGLQKIAFTSAEASSRIKAYESWIDEGKHGEMLYLSNPDRILKRKDLSLLLPGVKSVIMCMSVYWPGKRQLVHYLSHDNKHTTSSEEAKERKEGKNEGKRKNNGEEKQGNISCYAWGNDYHVLVREKLETICRWLHEEYGGEGKCYVDTGPIMERDLAERSGLGFTGKNTLLINEKLGSGGFLGCILSTLPIPSDPPRKKTGNCGKCRKCIDNCPTMAIDIKNGYSVDARKCISYLTIENKGEIPLTLRTMVAKAGYIYGCDICQLVCPWNRFDWPSNGTKKIFSNISSSSSTSKGINSSKSSKRSDRVQYKKLRERIEADDVDDVHDVDDLKEEENFNMITKKKKEKQKSSPAASIYFDKNNFSHLEGARSPLFGSLEGVPTHLRSPPLLSLLLALFYNNIDLYLPNSKTNINLHVNFEDENDLKNLLQKLLPIQHQKQCSELKFPHRKSPKKNPNQENKLVFNTLYKDTAIKRIGSFRMMRNIILVLGSPSSTKSLIPASSICKVKNGDKNENEKEDINQNENERLQNYSSVKSEDAERTLNILYSHLTLMLNFCIAKRERTVIESFSSLDDAKKENSEVTSSIVKNVYKSNENMKLDLYSKVILPLLPGIKVLSNFKEKEVHILIDQLQWTIAQIQQHQENERGGNVQAD